MTDGVKHISLAARRSAVYDITYDTAKLEGKLHGDAGSGARGMRRRLHYIYADARRPAGRPAEKKSKPGASRVVAGAAAAGPGASSRNGLGRRRPP